MGNREQVGWFCKAEFAAKTNSVEEMRILRLSWNNLAVRIKPQNYDEREEKESFASGKEAS